jgi:hypothetical protein
VTGNDWASGQRHQVVLLHVTMRLKTPAFCFFCFFDTNKRLEAIMRLVLHSSQLLKNYYWQKKFFSVLVKKI